jgi:hypothetical protein
MKPQRTRFSKILRGVFTILFISLFGLGVCTVITCAEQSTLPTLPEPGPVKTSSATKVSISPFPYDITPQAVQRVKKICQENGNLYTVQLDNGIPWQAALENKALPMEIQEDWEGHRSAITRHQQVYLAIAPLQDDRISLATDHGGKKAPSWVRNASPNDPKVLKAYQNYVLRAIKYFKPHYLNIGVEAGDMAAKKPGQWKAFVTLYNQTRQAVKTRHPKLQIGISWGLPLLMKAGVLSRCQDLINQSDYVGISFYPYMGQFYRKIGGRSIPTTPPAQWREPYKWLRHYVKKPIAICETAYSSSRVRVAEYGLDMSANHAHQSQYVEDLAKISQRDGYLFVVFFLAVDYDELSRKLKVPAMALWEHSGFFDKNLKPKPAWAAYQRAWLKRGSKPSESTPPSTQTPSIAPNSTSKGKEVSIPLTTKAGLFQSTSSVKPIKPNGMRWQYTYKKNDWPWAIKDLSTVSLAGTKAISFSIRSSRPGPLFLHFEETSGETHFKIIEVGSTWKTVSYPYSSFAPDPAKKKNGTIEPATLKSFMLADSMGAEKGIKGSRSIDISNIKFIR